jgi:hypothetical protein
VGRTRRGARDDRVRRQAGRQARDIHAQKVDVKVLKLPAVAGGNLQRVIVHVHAQLRAQRRARRSGGLRA